MRNFKCRQVPVKDALQQKRYVNTEGIALMVLVILLYGWTSPVRGNLTINATFDTSITSLADAAQWKNAINYAKTQFELQFTDPITINITFMVDANETRLGHSTFPSSIIIPNYATLKTLLSNDRTTADDKTAVAHLPAADPIAGTHTYQVTTAQAKALKIINANAPANDGTVIIGTNGNAYTLDASNRAVANKYDLIGVVSHEITEVMGRIGTTNWTGSDIYGPLDLFGYQFAAGGTGMGTFNAAANQANNYFSIDGGHTALKLYNDHGVKMNGEFGDNKDWATITGVGSNDSFNAFSISGVKNGVSEVDLREMDVIGYDRVIPEPATVLLGLLALVGLALTIGRRRVSSE